MTIQAKVINVTQTEQRSSVILQSVEKDPKTSKQFAISVLNAADLSEFVPGKLYSIDIKLVKK